MKKPLNKAAHLQEARRAAERSSMKHSLGPRQVELLRKLSERPSGMQKSQMLGNDWRVIDRLEELGMVDVSHQAFCWALYTINHVGKAALTSAKRGD